MYISRLIKKYLSEKEISACETYTIPMATRITGKDNDADLLSFKRALAGSFQCCVTCASPDLDSGVFGFSPGYPPAKLGKHWEI